jgi:hypothetical protein
MLSEPGDALNMAESLGSTLENEGCQESGHVGLPMTL